MVSRQIRLICHRTVTNQPDRRETLFSATATRGVLSDSERHPLDVFCLNRVFLNKGRLGQKTGEEWIFGLP